MDRDQVNCLHYLFQSDPIDKLAPDWWDRDREKAPEDRLFWCPKDTTDPLFNRNILQRDEEGYLQLPAHCRDLLDAVEQQLEVFPRPNYVFGYPLKAAIRKKGETRPAFLAISYAAEFEPVKTSVLRAASVAGFACDVPGDTARPGLIMDQIWQGIRRADVVVAETIGANPNVMLELGVAAALGKEVLLISQDRELPFDLKDWRKLAYAAGDLGGLEAKLRDAFAHVSARYPHEGKEPPF